MLNMKISAMPVESWLTPSIKVGSVGIMIPMKACKQALPVIFQHYGLEFEAEFARILIRQETEMRQHQQYKSEVLGTTVNYGLKPPGNAKPGDIWMNPYTFAPMLFINHTYFKYDYWISLSVLKAFNVREPSLIANPFSSIFIDNMREVENFLSRYKLSLQSLSEYQLLSNYNQDGMKIGSIGTSLEWTKGSYGTSAEEIAIAGGNSQLVYLNNSLGTGFLIDNTEHSSNTGIRTALYNTDDGNHPELTRDGIIGSLVDYLLPVVNGDFAVDDASIALDGKRLELRSPLEMSIVKDSMWQIGALAIPTNPVHTERNTFEHVFDILTNIHNLSPEQSDLISDLRVLALVHDNFKYMVDQSKGRNDNNYHGLFAHQFLSKYTEDPRLLFVVQHHDAAYNIFKRIKRNPASAEGPEAIAKLLKAISDLDAVNLYTNFFYVDSHTGQKTHDAYEWFKQQISAI